MKKNKFIEEYEYIDTEKRLVYRGPLFYIDLPPPEQRRIKILMLLSASGMVLTFIALNFAGGNATRVFYSGIFYVLQIIPSLFAVVEAVKFAFRKNPLERVHFEGSLLHILSWAVMAMVLSAGGVIGNIIFLIRADGYPSREFLFIPFSMLFFLFSWLLWKQVRHIQSKIIEKPTVDR
jgi:hypothetical protein